MQNLRVIRLLFFTFIGTYQSCERASQFEWSPTLHVERRRPQPDHPRLSHVGRRQQASPRRLSQHEQHDRRGDTDTPVSSRTVVLYDP